MRLFSFALAGAVSVATILVEPSPGLAAVPRPEIRKAPAFGAPIGGRGGIMTPYVGCASPETDPRARTTVRGVDSRYRKTFRYSISYQGAHFPRLAAGTYKVRTVARCDGARRARTQVVTVVQKTTATTMSRAEFGRIELGMTPSEVAAIVGYGGTSNGTYEGTEYRTFENMPFWSYSSVEFEDGIVSAKAFDFDHD